MWCSFVMYLLLFVTDPYNQAYQNVQASAIENANKLTDSMRVKRQTTVAEDIVIVMDGSGSSNACEFEKGKRALKNLMGKMRVPGYDTKYAAVTFSNSASVNFKFLPSSSAANEIMKIPHPGGSTNTQAGLAEAKNLFDDPSSGRRHYSLHKVVFLITDGQSNVQTHLTIPNAKALKDSGVEIYVVAVGAYIPGIDEMVKVASYPPNQHIFRVTSVRGSYDIVRLLLQRNNSNKWQIMPGQYDPPC